MQSNVFITGGSGFLGQEVIRRLDKNRYKVYALVRSDKADQKVKKLGAISVRGNMENIDSWKEVLSQMDIVIHAAAPLIFWAPWKFYLSHLVHPSNYLYQAAQRSGVKRFIFISSDAAIQGFSDLIDIDETVSYPFIVNSFYGKAKMLTERFILNYPSGEMQSIILRPPFIWGKNGKGTQAIINSMRNGDLQWINKGQALFEMVHVKNMAYAVELAVENTKVFTKQVYFITDDNTQTVYEFFAQLANRLKITLPDKNISLPKAYAIACRDEFLGRILRYRYTPRLKFLDVAFMGINRKYKIDKAKKDLGYKPIFTHDQAIMEF